MRRKNLASKAILRVKTVKGCNKLKEKIREAAKKKFVVLNLGQGDDARERRAEDNSKRL